MMEEQHLLLAVDGARGWEIALTGVGGVGVRLGDGVLGGSPSTSHETEIGVLRYLVRDIQAGGRLLYPRAMSAPQSVP